MKNNCFILFFILLLAGIGFRAWGQLPVAISFQDSLLADAGTSFTTNIIKLTNRQSKNISLVLTVSCPEGWDVLGGKKIIHVLSPKEETNLPVALRKSAKSMAKWKPVFIRMEAAETGFDSTIQFLIRAEAVYKALLLLTKEEQLVSNQKEFIDISFQIKNVGNAADVYKVSVQNDFFQLRTVTALSAEANETVPVHYKVKIPKEKWPMLKSEQIFISVTGRNGVALSRFITISKLGSLVKEHSSAYEVIDMQGETGLLLNGSKLNYYAGVSGSAKINKTAVSFSYRSKQYGGNNSLYRNLYNLNLTQEKWKATFGQLNDSRFFYGMGTGGYVQKKWGKGSYWYASAVKGDKFLKSAGNMVTGGAAYSLKKITVQQDVAFNSINNTRSLLVNNRIGILKKENLSAEINFGFGLDRYTGVTRAPARIGSSLGYKMTYKGKRFAFDSRMSENSLYFPGLMKGLKNQQHLVQVRAGKLLAGVFYNNNVTLQNPFKDTVYNSDALTFNTLRYGSSIAIAGKAGSLNVAAGKIKSSVLSNGLSSYNFIEYSSSAMLFKKLSFSLYSTMGMNPKVLYNDKPAVFNTTNARLGFRWGGVSGMYTNIPEIKNSGKISQYIKTFNIRPYVQLTLLKKINANLSYNISRTLVDNGLSSYITSSINYFGLRNGFDISTYGVIPIKSSQVSALGVNSAYFTITLRKKFSLPLISTKKFQKLKVQFFEDANHNQQPDAGERLFDSMRLKINDIYFQTTDKGEIYYKNIKKGIYTLDLTATPKGFVPSFGPVQKLEVKGDLTARIPLVRSQVIYGKILFEKDSLSNISFSPAGLKITATDSLNNVFYSLSDSEGNYFINVPSGYYKVSLNPSAFDDTFKPVKLFYQRTVINKDEEIIFEIKQQKRKVRLLKTE